MNDLDTASADLMTRACPACCSNRSKLFLKDEKWTLNEKTFQIDICENCDLLYTTPLPSNEELTQLYDSNYILFHTAPAHSTVSMKSWLFSIYRKAISIVINLLNGRRMKILGNRAPAKILDIGCGTGDFLATAKGKGWETYGVDFSEEGCKRSAAKGVKVQQGDLTSVNFPENFFHTVTLWHVLEHVVDPANVIAKIHCILHDDGRLIIEVPNNASLGFKVFERLWMPLDIPRHLQHFTSETLINFLSQRGFKVVERSDFQFSDFIIWTYNFLDIFDIRRRLCIQSITRDFGSASLLRQICFLACFIPFSLFSILLVMIGGIINSNGESITLICRKQSE